MADSKRAHSTGSLINDLTIKSTLFWIALFIWIGMGSVAIILFAGGWLRESVRLAIGMIPIVFAIGLNRRNNTQLAGSLIAITLTLIVTALATIGEGIYDIGVMAYPAILITAALVLRKNTTIYLAMLVMTCIGWLIFGDMYGLYQPLYPTRSFASDSAIAFIILIITATAVQFLSGTIHGNVNAIQYELEERKKMEQALRETEELYRNMVENTSVITYRDSAEINGASLYISPQIKSALGYSQAEWLAQGFWEKSTHPNDLPHVHAGIADVLRGKEKNILEYRLQAKDGRWVWFRDTSVVIRNDAGMPQYIHGMLLDITEQKNAEIKIKQREAILSAVAETAQHLLKSTNWRNEVDRILKLLGEASGASHVYIFENHLRPGDGILLSSMKYEWTAPGIKPELDNPNYQDSYLRPSVPGLEDWYANLSAGKAFYGSAQQYPRFWKKIFEPQDLKTLLDVPIFVNDQWWGIFGFDDYVNEMPWSQAEIDALMAAAGNLGISIEQQKADEGLRASEEKFNLAFQHTHVAMAISKISDSTLLDVNNAFSTITGYSRDEAIGKRAGKDLQIWADLQDRNILFKLLEQKGYVDEYKAKFRIKNGENRIGLLSAVNISIAGEACQLYAFVDISNMEHLLDELKAKNEELQSFTYTVSHDLKAPLVTISGFMGYLEQDARKGDVEKLNKDILRINEAVTKMQRLLTELLELSRIGRMMNPPENVPFGEIVREALKLVEGRLQAKQIQVNVEAALPSVNGDRARLVQVVQNLVDNAAKFMNDQENPRIEIGVDQINGSTVFFVRDNGAGIESEYFERIFGLFNKLDTDKEGTGIGLALVKRIIEVHGGKVWVESKGAGEGSTFYFTLAKQSDNKAQNEK